MNQKQAIAESIVGKIGCSEVESESIIDHYVKVGAFKFKAHDGYVLQHGMFMDEDILRAALVEVSDLQS